MKNKLSVKDLINIGIFSALYIVVLLVLVTVTGSIPLLYLAAPFFVGVAGASVYMLLAMRVPKKGSIMLFSVMLGVLLLSTNITATIFALLCGISAEVILSVFGRDTVKGITMSYLPIAAATAGPYLGILVSKDAYIAKTVDYYGIEYANTLAALTPSWVILVIVLVGVIGGMIGNIVAKRVLKKHFKKAGVV